MLLLPMQVKLCGNLTSDKRYDIMPNTEGRFNIEFKVNDNTNFKGFR